MLVTWREFDGRETEHAPVSCWRAVMAGARPGDMAELISALPGKAAGYGLRLWTKGESWAHWRSLRRQRYSLPAAQRHSRVSASRAGQLTCEFSGGIGLLRRIAADAGLSPSIPGPVEFYAGPLTKRCEISALSGGVMVWAVYAPSRRRCRCRTKHCSGRCWGKRPDRRLQQHRRVAAFVGSRARPGSMSLPGVAGIDLRWVR